MGEFVKCRQISSKINILLSFRQISSKTKSVGAYVRVQNVFSGGSQSLKQEGAVQGRRVDFVLGYNLLPRSRLLLLNFVVKFTILKVDTLATFQ